MGKWANVTFTPDDVYDLQCAKGMEPRPALVELVVRNNWGLLEMCAVGNMLIILLNVPRKTTYGGLDTGAVLS